MPVSVSIQLEVDEPVKLGKHNHTAITLAPMFQYDDSPPDAAMLLREWQLIRSVAGQLARFATYAEPFIREQRRQDGCRARQIYSTGPLDPPHFSGKDCSVYCSDLLDPNAEALVILNVPTKRLKVWKERVSAWLAVLAEAEHYDPKDQP